MIGLMRSLEISIDLVPSLYRGIRNSSLLAKIRTTNGDLAGLCRAHSDALGRSGGVVPRRKGMGTNRLVCYVYLR
jgi:hypothetical protein